MKKFLFFLLLICFWVMSAAPAQNLDLTGKLGFSAFGSVDVPTGFTAADPMEGGLNRKLGFDFGGAVDYFFTPLFGLGVDASYTTFDAEDFEGVESDDKFTVIMIGGHVKFAYPVADLIVPYVSAGAGLAMPKIKDATSEFGPELVDIKIDNQVYFAGNVGLMFSVTDMFSVFGEAGAVYISLKHVETTVETDEGDLDGGDFPGNTPFLNFKAGISLWLDLIPAD
ncbi:MAG: outer membrane beta-barrel protein [Aliifodinibius sp.]|nr:porin family protein [candidate division Zixibacteria bacterium]NIV10363.1 outer membrane beta-barrel protein [Fodinibius sp.]